MEAYAKLCDNRVLKEEFKIIERKRLTYALDFPQVFKIKWIKIVLRKMDDGFLWLENNTMKIKSTNAVRDLPLLIK